MTGSITAKSKRLILQAIFWKRSPATSSSLVLDDGYRDHNAPVECTFKVFTRARCDRRGQRSDASLRRRSAVEPVVGHLKSEHRMGRNYLWHRAGDVANAVLAAACYNFRRLLRWLQLRLREILVQPIVRIKLIPAETTFFTDDYLATHPNGSVDGTASPAGHTYSTRHGRCITSSWRGLRWMSLS